MEYDPDQMVRSYFKYRALEKAGDSVWDKLFGEADLTHEKDELDIMLRKRQLGLPYDTKDFDEATNDDKDFVSRATALSGRQYLQGIPGETAEKPVFKFARLVTDSPTKTPTFKVAELLADALPSVGNASKSGSTYGRIFGLGKRL